MLFKEHSLDDAVLFVVFLPYVDCCNSLTRGMSNIQFIATICALSRSAFAHTT